MIKHTLKKNADSTAQITIEVTAEFIEPIKAATIADLKKDLKISGFRPGKMPDNIAERHLGSDYVQSHVVEAVVMRAYAQGVKAEKLETIDAPQITLKKFVPYSELEFEAKVAIMPSFGFDAKKLIVKEPVLKIDKQEVDDTLKSLQKQMAKRLPSTEPIGNGDEVKLDFEGVREGKPVEGAAAKNQTITVGDKQFIPGFEENLIGLKKGDKKEFEVTFPEDYGHKDLAGAKVVFKVQVHEVNKVELPAINDEFAQSIGAFKTLAALKLDVEKSLEAQKADQQKKQYEQQVLDNALAKIEFTVPASLIEHQVAKLKEEVNNNLSTNGLTLEQYLKIQGKTESEVDGEIDAEANKRVKIALIVRRLVDDNKLTVSERELDEHYHQMKAQYTDPQIQKEMEHEHFRDDLKNHLLTEKAVGILLQYALGEKKS